MSGFDIGARVYTQEEYDRVVAERDTARETSVRLNRRATQAEAVVMQTVEDCQRQGISVGRALANAACNSLAVQRDRLRELLEDVWRSYTLLERDQAHLDHSMEAVQAFLFPEQAARTGEAPTATKGTGSSE